MLSVALLNAFLMDLEAVHLSDTLMHTNTITHHLPHTHTHTGPAAAYIQYIPSDFSFLSYITETQTVEFVLLHRISNYSCTRGEVIKQCKNNEEEQLVCRFTVKSDVYRRGGRFHL